MAGLEISPEKVGFVIVKTREVAAKVAAWDDGSTSDHDAESILESFSDDATQEQLKEFIRDLNVDEQASLESDVRSSRRCTHWRWGRSLVCQSKGGNADQQHRADRCIH